MPKDDHAVQCQAENDREAARQETPAPAASGYCCPNCGERVFRRADGRYPHFLSDRLFVEERCDCGLLLRRLRVKTYGFAPDAYRVTVVR